MSATASNWRAASPELLLLGDLDRACAKDRAATRAPGQGPFKIQWRRSKAAVWLQAHNESLFSKGTPNQRLRNNRPTPSPPGSTVVMHCRARQAQTVNKISPSMKRKRYPIEAMSHSPSRCGGGTRRSRAALSWTSLSPVSLAASAAAYGPGAATDCDARESDGTYCEARQKDHVGASAGCNGAVEELLPPVVERPAEPSPCMAPRIAVPDGTAAEVEDEAVPRPTINAADELAMACRLRLMSSGWSSEATDSTTLSASSSKGGAGMKKFTTASLRMAAAATPGN
mmetsp:Transcript_73684/g.213471  ORF Transcript_73684/g.213471 Transcript_73684/m.213471 type:complete len:285 (-) Transcript_73684:1325-2179(-)